MLHYFHTSNACYFLSNLLLKKNRRFFSVFPSLFVIFSKHFSSSFHLGISNTSLLEIYDRNGNNGSTQTDKYLYKQISLQSNKQTWEKTEINSFPMKFIHCLKTVQYQIITSTNKESINQTRTGTNTLNSKYNRNSSMNMYVCMCVLTSMIKDGHAFLVKCWVKVRLSAEHIHWWQVHTCLQERITDRYWNEWRIWVSK